MKRTGRMRLLGVGVACALVAGGLGARAWGDPPATMADDGFWQGLAGKLQSADATVRAGAIKDVAQVPWQGQRQLERLLAEVTDETVKGTIQQRLEAIGQQMAHDPPGISIDLHDATLLEAVGALEKATGVAMNAWPRGGGSGGARYTLTAKERPFWEVFAGLSAQHALMVQGNDDTMQVMEEGRGLVHGIPAKGGFFIFPGRVERSQTAELQEEEGNEMGPEQLSMQYTIVADPRTRVVGYQSPVLSEVTDDAGNDLLMPARSSRRSMLMTAGQVMFHASAQLVIPENCGKKIAVVKGEAHFLVAVSSSVVLVEKPETKLHELIKVGERTVMIQAFSPKDGRVDYLIAVPGPVARPRPRTPPQRIRLEIVDSQDETVFATEMGGGASGSVTTGDHRLPLRLRFSAPAKTEEVVVPFEMKDLPLP